MPPRSRANGFQMPLSVPQVTVVLVYMFLEGVYYFVTFHAPMRHESIDAHLFAVIDFSLAALCVLCWVAIEAIDPSKSFGATLHQSRYCQVCNKRVAGLDHHCIWLNTCVGGRNIYIFLSLVLVLFVQHSLQLVICGHFLTRDEVEKSATLAFVLLIFHQVIGGVFWLGITTLLGFHLYLQCWERKTTYEWLLSRQGWHSAAEDAKAGVTDFLGMNTGTDAHEAHANELRQEAWEHQLALKQQERHASKMVEQVNVFNSDYLSYASHSIHNSIQQGLRGSSYSAHQVVPAGGANSDVSSASSRRSSSHGGDYMGFNNSTRSSKGKASLHSVSEGHGKVDVARAEGMENLFTASEGEGLS